MANSVTTNPMVLDTAGAVTTDRVTIKAVVYTAVDGSTLLLSDAAGNALLGLETDAGDLNPSITVPGGIKADGLTVTTIDAGTAYVYLK